MIHCVWENVPCFITPYAVLKGCCRARLFDRGCFQSNANSGTSLYGSLFFICFLSYISPGNCSFKTTLPTKGNGLCVCHEAEEIANPINTFKCVGWDLRRAGARYNANISECIYVTGAALFCFVWKVQVHVGWENNSPRFREREESGRTRGIRDQTNRLQWEEKVEKEGKEEVKNLMERVTEKCSYTQPTGLSGVREEKDDCLFSNLFPVEIPLSIHAI